MEKESKLNELDKEKIKEATKERILSDAEFIKGGAEPVVDDEGNARLEITDRQIDGIKRDRDIEIEKERRRLLYEHVQQQGFMVGDKIKVKFRTGGERIFYIPAEPIHSDCINASVVPIDQLKTEEIEKNIVELWYRDMESVEKVDD